MPGFDTVLFAAIALLWLTLAASLLQGIPKLPKLAEATSLSGAECPRVSIVFSARDEAEKIGSAVESMLALDYSNFEVIAVNDRSRDATPEILNRRASGNPRLKVIHVSELPPGWLGKTHGLQRGYEASSGEWLLFTDADVRFAPDALRRAIRVVLDRQWDHLSLLSRFELKGFWESALMACFAMMGTLLIRPHRVANPKSRAFAGAGYFNLVRRAAYEASGTHRRLALEVVDDVKLGKIIKRAGFRSGVAMGDDFVTLRWQHGVGNIIRGLEKNGFAGIGFSVPLCLLMLLAAPAIHVLPFIAAVFARGWTQVFAGVAAVTAAGMHAAFARYLKCTPLVGVTYPICTLLMTYTLVRSAVLTLRRGGIVWRDTFYSLDQLRKGIV